MRKNGEFWRNNRILSQPHHNSDPFLKAWPRIWSLPAEEKHPASTTPTPNPKFSRIQCQLSPHSLTPNSFSICSLVFPAPPCNSISSPTPRTTNPSGLWYVPAGNHPNFFSFPFLSSKPYVRSTLLTAISVTFSTWPRPKDFPASTEASLASRYSNNSAKSSILGRLLTSG